MELKEIVARIGIIRTRANLSARALSLMIGKNASYIHLLESDKIYDFEKRFGYTMCVGCGRCDDVCPEYISYSNLVNRLAKEEQ